MQAWDTSIVARAFLAGLNPGRVQERAGAFLKQQQERDNHWQLCLEAFAASSHYEVQFWCLKSLLQVRYMLSGLNRRNNCELVARLMMTSTVECV